MEKIQAIIMALSQALAVEVLGRQSFIQLVVAVVFQAAELATFIKRIPAPGMQMEGMEEEERDHLMRVLTKFILV